MGKFEKFFFSTRTMTVLLILYGSSMGVATFIENDYDTATAKALIYDSKWFEFLMLWLILLFIGNIKKYNLQKRGKWPVLAFHLAFILLFIGGGITRYISFEGQMPIKTGDTTNEIISDKTYFKLEITDGDRALRYDKKDYLMSHFNSKDAPWPLKRNFKQDYKFGDKTVTMKVLDYVPMAKDSIRESTSGRKMLEVVTMGQGGRESEYIPEGQIKNIGGTMFSYNNPIEGSLQLSDTDGPLQMISPFDGESMSMAGQQIGMVTDSVLLAEQMGTVKVNEVTEVDPRRLYTINETGFIIPKEAIRGEVVYYKGDKTNANDRNLPGAITVEMESGNDKDTLIIIGGRGVTSFSKNTNINGLNVSVGFGSKYIQTPFSLRCDEFIMARYPGSDNPSSYESVITVIDGDKESTHDVYMNNVMDYKGYRFFQSSYFPDESGTILSVNADWWGTNITYLGYFLMFSGMFITLFWKGTRFWKLNEQLKKMHKKSFLLLPFFLWGGFAAAQDSIQPVQQVQDTLQQVPHENPGDPTALFAHPNELGKRLHINKEHADKFGHLLVQDFEGRIKPMNTQTLELLRKIYKKDKLPTENPKEFISSEQWFLSMQIDPAQWADVPFIKVAKKGGDLLLEQTNANEEGYTTYIDLIDVNTGNYKFEDAYTAAFSKRAADQTGYDKEVINVTERFNIFNNLVYGYYTKVIPKKNDIGEAWTSWIYSSAENPIEIDNTAYEFLVNYFNALKLGMNTDDWSQADAELDKIIAYQQEWGKNVVPSNTKVELEVLYNKYNVFFWLMIAYSMLGIILTLLSFIEVLSKENKFKKINHRLIQFFIGLTVIALIIQVLGLAVRWYLSGHAPWSNGYEAIVFISGVGVLSGLLLYRNRNAFVPAAGAIVAMIMMGFAHGGAMLDPQITPLVPVLKSYWLMVHVAIITSSYGFFGLSAVLATICLFLYCIKPTAKIKNSINEMSIVNEMSLTIGIFALTVGTFLGGMWANESWGRYWSWDPKETWAFVSVIFYAVVLHLRIVPGLKGQWLFNVSSLWAIWFVIMTYFGVNYYLDGLHTYATGDKIPIPSWIYITAASMAALTLISYFIERKNYPKNSKKKKNLKNGVA